MASWLLGDSLDELKSGVAMLIENQTRYQGELMATIQDLILEVGDMSSAVESAKTVFAQTIATQTEAVQRLDALKARVDELIAGGGGADAATLEALRSELDAVGNDLTAATTDLDTNSDALAEAVVRNTTT